MLDTYKKTLQLLTPKERRRGIWVLIMVVVMALLETIGLVAVMPFLSVLSNPEVVESNSRLSALYSYFEFQSVDSFLVFLGVAAFCLVMFAAVFRIVTTHVMNRFTQMRRHSISARLLETYLRQPYSFFLNRHSSEMAKGILSEVDQLVQNVFKPGFAVISYSIVGITIVALLIVVDPVLALIVSVGVGGSYLLVYGTVRGLLGRIGRDRADANKERFVAAGEALSGIKELKLLGLESVYLSRFLPPSIRFARHQATNLTISLVPKYMIEALGVGGVLALATFLIATRDGLGDAIPILGLYAFAGVRLLPTAQHIYSGIARIKFGAAAVDDVYKDLKERESLAEISSRESKRIRPTSVVELKDVSFSYPNSDKTSLRDINISIKIGSMVGIVGSTGAGKTTLVDVILGLLTPTKGSLVVDGSVVDKSNIRQWQNTLGYVPQEIFLADASISENIALGIPLKNIDYEKVKECARLAQIDKFIENELPNEYMTEIGERGARLSGGQRQRIGIARALYHDPDILVFDEATSALDGTTEKAVMAAVDRIGGSKTIIIIAHRLSTVRGCDVIFCLEGGRLSAKGRFEQIVNEKGELRTISEDSG